MGFAFKQSNFACYRADSILVNLQVDLIQPVIWNKESFESLVIDNDTKELIIALITNKLEAERATDLMAGKGNGLIILLHGQVPATVRVALIADYG